MEARREQFEFQSARYAANFANLRTPQEVVQRLFAPYISKYRHEYPEMRELTPTEIAARKLNDFLQENRAESTFNNVQRIVLIASSFDPQTLSTCAWLAKNGVRITCLRLQPIKYREQIFFEVNRIVPPPLLNELFVEVAEPQNDRRHSVSRQQTREALPKMAKLFEWGILRAGDTLYIRNHPAETAQVVSPRSVRYRGRVVPYNEWGQVVTGWSAINIYEWAVHAGSGKTLDALRRTRLETAGEAANTNESLGSEGLDFGLPPAPINPQELTEEPELLSAPPEVRAPSARFISDQSSYVPPKLEIAEPTNPRGASDSPRPSRYGSSPPRMAMLLEWGVIRQGDRLYIKGHPDKVAVVVDSRSLSYENRIMGYNQWGQTITGSSSINIYEAAILERAGKTLADLRREKANQSGVEPA